MIKDNLQHISYYTYLTPELQKCLKYLRDNDFSQLECGKYDIIEGKAYAIVQEYTTKPEEDGKYEAHRKYVDIQFIAQGEEKLGRGDLNDFEEISKYDEEKDIVFLAPKDGAKEECFKLIAGEFAIFTPQDVHMPCLTASEPTFVKKVVVKVAV